MLNGRIDAKSIKALLPTRDLVGLPPAVLRGVEAVICSQNNFTVAVLVNSKGWVVMGCAKRNPGVDDEDFERGRRIAVVRAVRNLQASGWR